MSELPGSTNDAPDQGVGRARGSPPGMPRWVKVFGTITVITLIVLFAALHMLGLVGMSGHH